MANGLSVTNKKRVPRNRSQAVVIEAGIYGRTLEARHCNHSNSRNGAACMG